jgi:hypothetical protein
MTLLIHDLQRSLPSEARRGVKPAETGKQLAIIKRFCLCVLTILLSGGALAAIVAFKTAIYFWRHKVGVG